MIVWLSQQSIKSPWTSVAPPTVGCPSSVISSQQCQRLKMSVNNYDRQIYTANMTSGNSRHQRQSPCDVCFSNNQSNREINRQRHTDIHADTEQATHTHIYHVPCRQYYDMKSLKSNQIVPATSTTATHILAVMQCTTTFTNKQINVTKFFTLSQQQQTANTTTTTSDTAGLMQQRSSPENDWTMVKHTGNDAKSKQRQSTYLTTIAKLLLLQWQ